MMIQLLFIYVKNIKKKKLYLFTIFIIFFIILITNILFGYYQQLYKDEIVNNIRNRQLSVELDDESLDLMSKIEEVKKLEFVNDAHLKYPLITLRADVKGAFNFDYLNEKDLTLLAGRYMSNDENEILVPNSHFSKEDLLNEYITFQLADTDYTFKIVGIYIDNNYSNIYISEQKLKEICLKENYSIAKKTFIIVVDKYEHVKKVVSELETQHLTANFIDYSGIQNIDSYKTSLSAIRIFSLIFISISFMLIFLITKNMIMSESKDISFMKISGYRKNQILFILFMRSLILIGLISLSIFFIYNVFYWFLFIIKAKHVGLLNYIKGNYLLHLYYILTTAAILVFLNLISCIFVQNKVNKISLIELFKES